MACLVTTISGAYGVAWDSAALGKDESGYRLIARNHQAPVRSDYYGDSLLDLIYRGQDVSLMFSSLEYASADTAGSTSTAAAFWPWHATIGNMGVIGRTACASLAQSLVLTAVAGTPAVATPASLTALYALLAEGHSLELLFANQVRTVPFAFNFLPHMPSSLPLWFVLT